MNVFIIYTQDIKSYTYVIIFFFGIELVYIIYSNILNYIFNIIKVVFCLKIYISILKLWCEFEFVKIISF